MAKEGEPQGRVPVPRSAKQQKKTEYQVGAEKPAP
jgi:hypothetical protein